MRQKRLVSVRMRGVGIGVWGFWATAQDGAHGVIARAEEMADGIRLVFPHGGRPAQMFTHICQARRYIEGMTGCRVRIRSI
ncbi:hypothetical protein HAZ28_004776 [Salmonella enterica]|nr:hypothetical protein [Salmonella enterica]